MNTFLRRLAALVVLLIAGWILLRFAIGLLTGVATVIVIVLAVVAVAWSARTLRR